MSRRARRRRLVASQQHQLQTAIKYQRLWFDSTPPVLVAHFTPARPPQSRCSGRPAAWRRRPCHGCVQKAEPPHRLVVAGADGRPAAVSTTVAAARARSAAGFHADAVSAAACCTPAASALARKPHGCRHDACKKFSACAPAAAPRRDPKSHSPVCIHHHARCSGVVLSSPSRKRRQTSPITSRSTPDRRAHEHDAVPTHEKVLAVFLLHLWRREGCAVRAEAPVAGPANRDRKSVG